MLQLNNKILPIKDNFAVNAPKSTNHIQPYTPISKTNIQTKLKSTKISQNVPNKIPSTRVDQKNIELGRLRLISKEIF